MKDFECMERLFAAFMSAKVMSPGHGTASALAQGRGQLPQQARCDVSQQ